MKYRLLQNEEYDRLVPIFGKLAPLPDLSYVGIAETNGKIVAVMNTHLQLHLDHFWIDPQNHSLIDWRKIWKVVEGRFPPVQGLRVYAAPTFSNGERMGEILGFSNLGMPMLVKEY